MPSWINTRDVSSGDYFDAQAWNNIVAPYGSLAYFTDLTNGATSTNVQVTQTGQVISNITYTTVTWSSATIVNTNMWTSGSDITLPSAGIYFITSESRYTTSSANARYTKIQYSSDGGSSFSDIFIDGYAQGTTLNHSIFWYTIRNRSNTSGRLRMQTYQASGANNTLIAHLTVQKLGDLFDY
jgi:hypothetical protein